MCTLITYSLVECAGLCTKDQLCDAFSTGPDEKCFLCTTDKVNQNPDNFDFLEILVIHYDRFMTGTMICNYHNSYPKFIFDLCTLPIQLVKNSFMSKPFYIIPKLYY